MKTRRIIFVGIHNKPPLKPLDASSASGKRLEAAISLLDFAGEIVKTNLYDADYLPTDRNEVVKYCDKWLEKYKPQDEDVIVLLGTVVQKHFPPTDCNIVYYGHPSPKFSREKEEDYAMNLSMIIQYALK